MQTLRAEISNPTAYRSSVKVVQFLPGRIGLRVSALKNAASYARKVKKGIETIIGVIEVDISTRTGSVLINYDINRTSNQCLDTLLDKLAKFFPDLDCAKLAACIETH